MKAKSMIFGLATMFFTGMALAEPATVLRVSESMTQQESDNLAIFPSVSPDGNYISFRNLADNLSEADENDFSDIYLYDKEAQTCSPVSITPTGTMGDGDSTLSSVSKDGRFVAFESAAANLVANDTNDFNDVFVKNMQNGVIERVSVAIDGSQANGRSGAPAISADGNLIVFESEADNLVPEDDNGVPDIFIHDRKRGRTWRLSVDGAGLEGDGASYSPDISSDGKWVVFQSQAENLVDSDTNEVLDIFLKPVKGNGAVQRLSVNPSGFQGNDHSSRPSISSNGRYISFDSQADNLVDGDDNDSLDVFVVDREEGTITRVSVNSVGEEGNGDSFYSVVTNWGGAYFHSWADNFSEIDTNRATDIFWGDGESTYLQSQQNLRTVGNGASMMVAASDNGFEMAFISTASNLAKSDNNGTIDIFYKNLFRNEIKRANLGSAIFADSNGPSSNPSINKYAVAYESTATNLVSGDTNGVSDIFVYNRRDNTVIRASEGPYGRESNGPSSSPRLSPEGRFVVFESLADNLIDGDTNGRRDIYIKLLGASARVERVMGAGGVEPNSHCYAPDPSNSNHVAFYSQATNLVVDDGNRCSDVFVYTIGSGAMERVSINDEGEEGNGPSAYPAITPDARYVAFVSSATNLADGDTNRAADVFVRDMASGTIERVSINNEGEEANRNSYSPDISDDGRYVSFFSNATNLVENDTNEVGDIFVYDRINDTITRASVSESEMQGDGISRFANISGNGQYLLFESSATNLVSGDTNEQADIFVRDLRGGHTSRMSFNFLGGELDELCRQPVISGNGLHIAYVSSEIITSGDANGVDDVFLAYNPLPVLAPGTVFNFSGSEINGFTDAVFSNTPVLTVNYTDPIRGRASRKRLKVINGSRDGVRMDGNIQCEWKNKVRLYNKASRIWKTNYCREALFDAEIAPVSVNLTASVQMRSGETLENVNAGEKFLVMPEISFVLDFRTAARVTNVTAGQNLYVGGAFFGSKLPKVWLEYKDAKGRIKMARCRVNRSVNFEDSRGNPNRSCMDLQSGISIMVVEVPERFPKDWKPGRHDLVIDNGIGRAYFRLLTE